MNTIISGTHEVDLDANAQKYLGIETLETRHLDELDFHDVAVWNVKAAMLAVLKAAGHGEVDTE